MSLDTGMFCSDSPKGIGRDHSGVICSFLSQVLRVAHTSVDRVVHYPWPDTAVPEEVQGESLPYHSCFITPASLHGITLCGMVHPAQGVDGAVR